MSQGAKTIKKNTNSTQNKFETHCAKQYEVTSFLSTDCELSTETCSKNVYSLGPRCSRMRLCGLTLRCRDPAGPWDRGGDETSQSKNLSLFGRLRLAGM